MKRSENSLQDFWNHVDKTESGCWLWRKKLGANGYGNYPIRGFPEGKVHRISYHLLKGPIPRGLHLDHLCRVRHCLNPEHLEPVTRKENAQRGANVLGPNRGERHHLAKLTDAEVEEVRRLLEEGMSQASIARKVGTSQTNVSFIKNGKRRNRGPETVEESLMRMANALAFSEVYTRPSSWNIEVLLYDPKEG